MHFLDGSCEDFDFVALNKFEQNIVIRQWLDFLNVLRFAFPVPVVGPSSRRHTRQGRK